MRQEKINQIELEQMKEVENCRKAIILYQEGLIEFRGGNVNKSTRNIFESVAGYSCYSLALENSDGQRLGPFDAKLRYEIPKDRNEKMFSIHQGGMDDEYFQKWQKFIGKKFEENGLEFYYF